MGSGAPAGGCRASRRRDSAGTSGPLLCYVSTCSIVLAAAVQRTLRSRMSNGEAAAVEAGIVAADADAAVGAAAAMVDAEGADRADREEVRRRKD